jgi:replicative DNA helicase
MQEQEFFDVPLPCDPQAERVILGAIMLDDSLFEQVRSALEIDDFSLEKHRRIFARMADLHERGERIDYITLANELERQGQRESVDGLSYLVSLTELLPQMAHVESYERIVQDKSILRRAAHSCSSVMREILGSGSDSAMVVERMQSLTEKLQGCLRADEIPTVERAITETGADVIFGGGREVIPTPWPRLNQIIGGFEAGQMVCIGARPSMGKTVLACQIAVHAAELGKNAMIFSLEMSNVSLIQRFISALTGIPHYRVREGRMDAKEKSRAQEALLHLTEIQPLYMAELSFTIPAIRAQLSKLARKRKVDLVVIDYLQMISTMSNRNRVEQITEISRGVKLLAKQFDCAVVVTSQLSRESEKENREPRLSDLRDSGSIEQDCDLVIFPHRAPNQEPDEQHVRTDLIVAKQRNGRLGRVPTLFQKPFVRFVEEVA